MAAVEQRRRSAGVHVLAAGVATAYRNRHKKDQGGNVVLTEGLKLRMLQCRMAGGGARQSSWARSLQDGSGLLIPTSGFCVAMRSQGGGQRG